MTGQESIVSQTLQGIASWTYPVDVLPTAPLVCSSSMAPMSHSAPQTPLRQYAAPAFHAGSPLFMPQQLPMSYYGTTPGILLPGFLPNYAAMPPTQQGPYPMYPFPAPQLPPPPQLGFPQDTAMKLVERVLKELQGIRAGQETGFQNVETGIQNEFQALQQSLTKRGADGNPAYRNPTRSFVSGTRTRNRTLTIAWRRQPMIPPL